MKKKTTVTIPAARWMVYAGAGAATALTVATAEAEIHYSGRLDVTFPGTSVQTMVFQLDKPGDEIVFFHFYSDPIVAGHATFQVNGLKSAGFVGYLSHFLESPVASKITDRRQYVSNNNFLSSVPYGEMAVSIFHSANGPWREGGNGFVGFRFNNGAGFQYGWARVRMHDGTDNFAFKVVGYAYADPGEPIRFGQRESSSSEKAPDQGSLGLLALGAGGLAMLRKKRQADPKS